MQRDKPFGRYAAYARCPRREERHGVQVDHPRYPLIPKLSVSVHPALIHAWVRGAVRRLQRQGYDFDLIDSHYFYPDGVAAVRLGMALGKPVTITARGSDLSELAELPRPRAQIQWAARHAAGLITVCQALKDKLVELGVAPDRVRVLRNGVDLEAFRPGDRDALRRRLEFDSQVLLSVGLLIPRKAHHLTIEAMAHLPGKRLLIAGDGEERPRLEALIQKLDLDDRVTLLGRVPHEQLKDLYAAADALVLASSREGWANVLL